MTCTVRTVTGPIPLDDLGVTVTHEHLFLDSRDGFDPRPNAIAADLLVTPQTRPAVDRNPLSVVDNLLLDDVDVAVNELVRARETGVHTLLDVTSLHTGRRPELLAEASLRSGVNVVMGSGYYMERAMPVSVRTATENALVALLDADVRDGVETPIGRVLPGVMGEIGLSAEPTSAERKSLRAAARVAAGHGLPLLVHLPAWLRLGHIALDEVAAAVPDYRGVLLCHLNPMAHDVFYLRGLAERGAWLGLDMMGNHLDYGDGRKSPDEDTNLANLLALLDAGLGRSLLLSSDVGQKNMLLRNGGQGYGYVPRRLVPELRRRGIGQDTLDGLLIGNPRRWFLASSGPEHHVPASQPGTKGVSA